MDILALLPCGKENAISAEELRMKIGAGSLREVRQYVADARLSGKLICSGITGYYKPASLEEIREFVQRMERQAKSTFAVIKTARAALQGLEALEVNEQDTGVVNNRRTGSGREATAEGRRDLQTVKEQHEKQPMPAGTMKSLRARLSSTEGRGRNYGKA